MSEQLKLEFPDYKNKVIVYTDGACKGNPGPSGIGIVIYKNGRKETYKKEIGIQTNNIAELTAVKEALKLLLPERNKKIVIYTDSNYVIGVLTKDWKIKANKELIKEIKELLKNFPKIEFKKVPAHKGNIDNELVDRLANSAIKQNL